MFKKDMFLSYVIILCSYLMLLSYVLLLCSYRRLPPVPGWCTKTEKTNMNQKLKTNLFHALRSSPNSAHVFAVDVVCALHIATNCFEFNP